MRRPTDGARGRFAIVGRVELRAAFDEPVVLAVSNADTE